MQRKNSILISARSGMAMIMAITVIVVMATIMALSLALTTTTTKKTVDMYLYEQSVLLSKSATEYALLQIAQNNSAANPCNITSLNFTPDLNNDGSTSDDLYDINITIKYAYTNLCAIATDSFAVVQTPEQNGSAQMDVTVSVTPDKNVASEPIRYFRRTIQKL